MDLTKISIQMPSKAIGVEEFPQLLAVVTGWMRVPPIKMGKVGERIGFAGECNSGIFFGVVKLEIAVKEC